MTTPPVPLISADGSEAAHVPYANAQAAVDAGAVPAIVLRDHTDGSRHAVPVTKLASALAAGGMTEGQYQESIGKQQQPGQLDLASQAQATFDARTKADPNAGFLTNVGRRAMATVGAPIVHPLDTLHAIAAGLPSASMIMTPAEAAANPLTQRANEAASDYHDGGASYAGSKLLGDGIGLAITHAMVHGVPGVGAAADESAPTSPLSLNEQSALSLTKAINPSLSAWQELKTSLASQFGNVSDYAQRNGLTINNSHELSKVAGLAADESAKHYADNVLGPHGDIERDVTEGPLTGKASLSQIDSRVGDINQELRAAYRKPTPGQTASSLAGASDAELMSERAHLTGIIHQSLGDLNGMDPRDVFAARQRTGQLRTIQSESVGAANSISSADARQTTGAGGSIPTSKSEMLSTVLAKIAPGLTPESQAAKALQRAISASTIEPTALADTYPGAHSPGYVNPGVVASQQALARQAALAYTRTNDMDPVRASNSAIRAGLDATQQASAIQAATEQVRREQAQADLPATKTAGRTARALRRFTSAPSLDPSSNP